MSTRRRDRYSFIRSNIQFQEKESFNSKETKESKEGYHPFQNVYSSVCSKLLFELDEKEGGRRNGVRGG
jgi:hypothetical protein